MQIGRPREPRQRDGELQRAYALWAPVYPAAPHNPLMRAEQRVMESLLARLTWERALDVGTGTGRYLPILAAHRGTRVVGIDFSIDMLIHGASDTRRVCARAAALPFPGASFDLALASLMVGDVRDLDGWAAEMARVLRPGGRLLYSDFHETWATLGWERRIETADGERLTLPYWPHALTDHRRALDRAGLTIEIACDVALDDRDGPSVAAFRARWGGPPVAVVLLAGRGASGASHREG